MSRKQVAEDPGVGFSTLNRWIRQDRRDPQKPSTQSDLEKERAELHGENRIQLKNVFLPGDLEARTPLILAARCAEGSDDGHFDKVLDSFSREDTLTSSLQDWRKPPRERYAHEPESRRVGVCDRSRQTGCKFGKHRKTVATFNQLQL
ncbi:hypothetical protein [uncultured Roseibium sp.]|uniref:hypothetical protein n=1 Tax=uncultured Roseibium sp. TaxID=1936171 RepID=UPI003216C0C8